MDATPEPPPVIRQTRRYLFPTGEVEAEAGMLIISFSTRDKAGPLPRIRRDVWRTFRPRARRWYARLRRRAVVK